MSVRVIDAPFDAGAELSAFAAGKTDAGAVVTFSGIVRDTGGALQEMQIEHYPGMTEKALSAIAEQARTRWNLTDVLVIHRYGVLRPGELIMMVATSAAHRAEAFEAAEFLMDYLKSRAPFWKKEVLASGAAEWVDARASDEDALSRW